MVSAPSRFAILSGLLTFPTPVFATDVLEPEECPQTYVAGFFKLDGQMTVGEVVVRYHVDAAGTPQAVLAEPSKLGNRIDRAAVRAVKKWRYADQASRDASVTLILSNHWRKRPESCIHLTIHDFSSMSEAQMRAFNEINAKEN